MGEMAKNKDLTCELHCHTQYSWDCEVPVQRVIEIEKERGVNVLAITDHNEIAGAFEAARLAPTDMKIIIGEEISTQEGHLIGLFLKEKIEPHQSAEQTIAEIRRQGGIVLIPHPFDRVRGGFGEKNLLKVKDKIDFLEVFNARVLFVKDNMRALDFAKTHRLSSYVGTDGHTFSEYAHATNTIASFTTQEEFLSNLKQAQFTTKLSGFKVYVLTEWVKLKKKVLRIFAL